MKEKNKRNLLIVMILLIISFIIIGVSYAIWQVTLTQTDKNVVTTGCFKVEFTDTNPINLEKSYPILDEEGMKLVPYEFIITNTCDDNASFQINLEVLNESSLMALDTVDMVLNESTKDGEIVLLESNEVTTKTLDNARISYKLKKGYLKSNESKTFNLRLWLDEDTPTDEAYMNKTFLSKITVVTSYITEIDEELPIASFTTLKTEEGVLIDASSSTDNIGIVKYYYSMDGKNYIPSTESSYTFKEGSIEYGLATETISKLYTNKVNEVFVRVEDDMGNISEVKKMSIGELIYDETADNNLRYIGASPNNYIDIGDRDAAGNIIPWRIIGVMNNVGDGKNNETRLKIIRSEDIGGYSWDTSASSINNGRGVNEWSEADLMKLLNPGYESESIGGSLYWNSGSGNCYNNSSNANTACNFTSSGLSNDAKSHIGEALWHTGSNGSVVAYNNILTSKFYELEKSNNVGKICTSGEYCNDTVERTTAWKGVVGLMSPADYGYATSGGNNTNRETCLNTKLYSWEGSGVEECKKNHWLYKRATELTLMPSANTEDAYFVFSVYQSGFVSGSNIGSAFRVRPVVYLKADTKIISGDGTLDNIFNIQA